MRESRPASYSAVRIAAIIIFIAAIALVSFSGAKTVRIIKENMRAMVRQNADVGKTFKILKKLTSGSGEKGDLTELAKSVFGLIDQSDPSQGREMIPDLLL